MGAASDARGVDAARPEHVSTCAQLYRRHAPLGAAVPDFGLDPIDAILATLGADNVAEITGRKRRVLAPQGGPATRSASRTYAAVPPLAAECAAFRADRKRVAVISRAGSTGVSLHGASARVHICLELPWSAEELLQQCGRADRTRDDGGAGAPKYVFVATDVPAERRFGCTLATRLQHLNALTQGDRGAAAALAPPPAQWGVAARRRVALHLAAVELRASLGPLPPMERRFVARLAQAATATAAAARPAPRRRRRRRPRPRPRPRRRPRRRPTLRRRNGSHQWRSTWRPTHRRRHRHRARRLRRVTPRPRGCMDRARPKPSPPPDAFHLRFR